tara:strand:+ start:793 stop:1272 length:480 start_codon:yes stop_codon:yes gene_type:complete
MNRFYRKPKPETMRANRESYAEVFKEEMSWLKENLQTLTQNKHKFLIEMYTILVSGSRKVTPKMASTIKSSIEKCKNNPNYNEELREEADKKLQPILAKINIVRAMAEGKGDYSVDFIKDVELYVRKNYRITKKQMAGLNKVYKRLTDNLFEGDKDETK